MLRKVRAMIQKKFPHLSRWLSRASWIGANLGFGAGLFYALAQEFANTSWSSAGLWSALLLFGVSACAGLGSALVFRFLGRGKATYLSSEDGKLTLTDDGGNTTEIHADEIESVLRGGTRIWLGLRNGTEMDIRDLSQEQAQVIEAQFGRRAYSVVAGPPPRVGPGLMWMAAITFLVGIGTLVAEIPPDHAAPIAVYTGALFAGWIATFQRSGTLDIGADGIVVSGEFIPYQDLLQLTSERGKLVVVRQDSSRRTYPVTLDIDLTRALDRSLRDRMDAAVGAGEVYDRQPKESILEWVARLRRLFEARDFRHGMASKEEATVLLRAPKVPFRVRVGIATALAESSPAAVRDAIDDMADPRLASIAVAAFEGDEALVQRLEALDA